MYVGSRPDASNCLANDNVSFLKQLPPAPALTKEPHLAILVSANLENVIFRKTEENTVFIILIMTKKITMTVISSLFVPGTMPSPIMETENTG